MRFSAGIRAERFKTVAFGLSIRPGFPPCF